MATTAPKKPRTKKAPVEAVEAAPVEIVSIKGFDKDWKCRGYQYAVGQTYTHDGKAVACQNGFHACTTEAHPLSVFDYYPPAGSRFALVRQFGDTNSDDSIKIASTKITIDIEISIGDLVKRAWDYVWSRCTVEPGGQATGDQGAASATGYRGAASATGYQGAASATGYRGAASATGYQGAASATGDQGAASATGYRGAASATGYQGAASATGDQGAAFASGYSGTVSGIIGNALCAVERDDNWNIVSVACGIVGKDGIEPNTSYRCVGGKLVA